MVRRLVLSIMAGAVLWTTAMAQTKATPQQSTDYINPDQQIDLVPNLWFSGTFGTVGAANRTISIHAPFNDVVRKQRCLPAQMFARLEERDEPG